MNESSTHEITQDKPDSHIFFNRDPQTDMNFEQKLVKGTTPSIIIYGWDTTVLILGNGQKIEEINSEICEKENIPVLRRRTGGTGVLHSQTLNIGLILPATHPWTKKIKDFYKRLLLPVGNVLLELGIPVKFGPADGPQSEGRTPICFETHGDDSLLLDGKKVFGCAQHRSKNSIIVHGTLFLDMNFEQQGRVFNVTPDHIKSIMAPIPCPIDRQTLANQINKAIANTLK